ncbi:MAG: hypothetical protein NTZ26_09555 [Candidatus Aminicenantes bacterium]|nr:hypothetical protein [Candidatus Aminicenantes bacterium]
MNNSGRTMRAAREAKGELSVALFGKPLPFKLGPCQIKTYMLPLDKRQAPRETNLVEGMF